MSLSRRRLFTNSGAALLLGSASSLPAAVSRPRDAAAAPHFFLEIFIAGGWDVSYLFDARPLAMTAAGKIQNYAGEEPELWTDRAGRKTWVGPAAQPLKKHFDSFSILNGVHMATSFDGHDQNALYSLTGNPFGGDTHLALFGRGQTPLDFLQQGSFFGSGSIRNKGRAITLGPQSALALTNSVALEPSARRLGQLIDGYVGSRLEANGASQPSSGLFADGSFKFREALRSSDEIESRLRRVKLDFSEQTPIQQNMQVLGEYFRTGLTRSAVVFLNPSIDAHDGNTAKNLPQSLKTIMGQLAQVFEYLKATAPVSAQNQSLMDETTILISSEFSRTMRQAALPLDKTGTDHNPLNNTVLLGGKGIKAGLIVGASDFREATETLSGAHLEMDASALSIMGLPFDRSSLSSLPAYQPQLFPRYQIDDYLNFAAIANTLFELFGCDASHYWTNERNGPPVRGLRGLLV